MKHLRPRSPLALVTSSLLASVALAQEVKLSGPLARPIGGDIRAVELSPDGERIAYVADQETDSVFELFVTKPDLLGGSVKLASPSVAGGGVYTESLWMGPQSEHVVFSGDLGTDDQLELFSVPLAGGPVVRLNAPMALHGDVQVGTGAVQIDPDETRVVWLARPDAVLRLALFSAPIDGGPAVRLDVPVPGASVRSFRISPDGTRVVYRVYGPVTQLEKLHVVPITGGTSVWLSPADTWIDEQYAFDASGTQVVFVGAAERGDPEQLYVAPLDAHAPAAPLLTASVINIGEIVAVPGSPFVVCSLAGPQRLAAVPLDGSGERILDTVAPQNYLWRYRVTSDASRAVFSVGLGGSSVQRLGSVLLDGSAPAISIEDLPYASPFELTPDSARVAYVGTVGLRSARVDGSGAPIDLAPAFPRALALTPDGARIVFQAFGGSAYQLGSVPVLGGQAPVLLNRPLPYGGNVEALSPDRPFRIGALGDVVYLADQREDERFELFSVPAEGGRAPLRLNDPLPIGPVEGDVFAFETSADGLYAVFAADELVNDRFELFSVRTDGSAERVRLHEPLAADEDVYSFAVSPDSRTVVYLLERAGTLEQELRAVGIEGGTPVVLTTAAPFVFLYLLLIDPTGTRLVYVRTGGASTTESVLLDGSAPPVVLGSAAAIGAWAKFSPDGTRLVSLADVDGDSSYVPRLYSLPIDGSAPGVHLDGGGRVASFTLSPDGTRALFVADSITAGQSEAFSAPIDGSAAALRLTPPLAPHADVTAVREAGGFAFYLATQDTFDQVELYRVPLDGSATSIQLNAPLVPLGDVRLFEPTPDGSRVVYHADQELDERYELYSVRGDGSGPVAKLNPPLGGGDVGGDPFRDDLFNDAFELSPDGARVAFRADPTVRDARELLVAPVDGSAPAVRVSPAPEGISSTVLSDYAFSPDGRSLVFRWFVHRAFGGLPEYSLYRVRADGLRAPRRISGPGVTVPAFRWLPGARGVVFQHDTETADVVELFASPIATRGAATPTRSVTHSR